MWIIKEYDLLVGSLFWKTGKKNLGECVLRILIPVGNISY